jgi:hypothetical protein
MLKGDYWPLTRNGPHVVLVQDAAGNLLNRSHFASSIEAESFANQERSRNPHSSVTRTMLADYLRNHTGLNTHQDIVRLEKDLQDQFLDGLNPNTPEWDVAMDSIRDVVDLTREYYLSSLEASSAQHYNQHRSKTKGYSRDFTSAYAQYMIRSANLLSSTQYGAEKIDNLRQMREYVSEMSRADTRAGYVMPEPWMTYDPAKATAVYNSMVERERLLNEYKSSAIVQAISKVTFLTFLTSPSQYVVQTSQVPIFWMPTIAARKGVGMSKATSAMFAALRDQARGNFKLESITSQRMTDIVNDLFEVVTPNNLSKHPGKTVGQDILTDADRNARIAKLPANEQELLALRIAADMGTLELGLANDLQRGANDNWGIAKTRLGHRLNQAVDMMGWFMKHSEFTNRRTAMIGTYRINRDMGKGYMASIRDAIAVTEDTQFNYHLANKAPIVMGNWMRVFTQIQSFRIFSAMFQLTAFHRAFLSGNVSPEMRTEARRLIAWQFGMAGLYAGILGTPAAMGLKVLVEGVIRMVGDDEDFDLDREMDAFLRDIGNDTIAQTIMRGVPAGLLNADISKRTEIASTFQSDIMFNAPEGLTGGRKVDWIASQLLGPSYAMAGNWLKSFEDFEKGDYARGIERSAPAILRDYMRMYRETTDGVRGGSDIMLMDPSQLRFQDYLVMGMGLQPTRLMEMKEDNRATLDRNTVLSMRRTKLVNEFARALENGNARAEELAIEAIYDWNSTHPVYGIGVSDLRSSLVTRLKADLGIQSERYQLVAHMYGTVR